QRQLRRERWMEADGDAAEGSVQPDALAGVPPAPGAAAAEKPTRERAFQLYASEHGMAVEDVTETMLENTDLGVDGWACKGLDVNARGPIGAAVYRAFIKHPDMRECYKWLFDDLKRKFRTSWAMQRNFDFVCHKRIHEKRESTKHSEIGSFKSELQLQAHLGGVAVPEAVRQAACYIKNCEKWPDVFVRWNSWTEAHNYLLVERLITSTSEEAWKDVVAMHDSSGTFETESYKCKAIRKYAAFHRKAPEACSIDDVVKSPHGLKGWAEMQIAVPGVEEGLAVPAASTPSPPGAPPLGDPAAVDGQERGEKAKRGSRRANAKGSAKPKAKKELSQEKEAENTAKDIICKVQKSQQIMEKILQLGDDLPSEWRWAKSFLVDYKELTQSFKDVLTPKDGDSLIDFVNELKLTLISPQAMKGFKKQYGDRYAPLLLLFNDRSQNIASQILAGGLGVQDLAVHPSQAVKHGSEHIKNAAGKIYPEPNLTRVFTPMYVKRETRRVEQDIPVYLPSQAFKDYVDDLAAQTWANMPRLVGDIGIYKNHPVVVQAELENNQITVRPIALYWDGVQYTNHDSFMGFYVTDILSGQKFLSFLVRSDEMCSCGCRGWCTLHPLLLAWVEDLKRLEEGYPVRYAVIDIQGDWPAFLQVFGLRYWAHKTHPCPLCRVTLPEMLEIDVDNITADNLLSPLYQTEDYAKDVADSTKAPWKS
ncbi:unnamed protein product, partial [Effrenium voratum]